MAVTFVVSRGTGAGAEHGVVGTGVTPAGGLASSPWRFEDKERQDCHVWSLRARGQVAPNTGACVELGDPQRPFPERVPRVPLGSHKVPVCPRPCSGLTPARASRGAAGGGWLGGQEGT